MDPDVKDRPVARSDEFNSLVILFAHFNTQKIASAACVKLARSTTAAKAFNSANSDPRILY